jgi:ATP-dependent exoDNAse (exonuclease V) alpha subunit
MAVAIYRLNMKSFGRSAGKRGSRATSGAAYRAGERIRDERTGAVYDHTERRDVLHKEIVLPAQWTALGLEMAWARDRARLWNAAEHAESRRDARVAREFTLALPHELAHEQRVKLAQVFARDLANRYQHAVDVAIHAPRTDPRNFHAHLLATTREVSPEGLGPKTSLELSNRDRYRRGLPRIADELRGIRERWAAFTNEALKEAQLEVRVSHLSLRAQGIDREPIQHIPRAALEIERRGGRSLVAERLRARYAARVEQRNARRALGASQHAGAAGPAAERAIEPARVAAAPGSVAASPTGSATVGMTLEQVRARARANWLAGVDHQRARDGLDRAAPSLGRDSPDDDLAL